MAIDPISLGLLGAGIARAGVGIAQGIGQARAAQALRLTPGQEEELKRLQERQRAGELGLTEAEKTALRKAGEGQQLAISREMEAQQLQQMAAQPQAVSGRDIFLREQAAQTAMRTAAQQQEAAIMEANIAEREQELARIAALEGQRMTAEAQERAARAEAVSLGLAGAADVGMTALQMAHQTKMQEAQIPKQSDTDLLRLYRPQPTGYTFGGLVPLS